MSPLSLILGVKLVRGTGLPHRISIFLHALRDDILVLFAKNLPREVTFPDRKAFRDAATYAATVRELGRRHHFAVVQQAVRKQMIRESLWPRFYRCAAIFSFVLVPLAFLAMLLWVACMLVNPAIFHAIAG
jgi:hypothetical protein